MPIYEYHCLDCGKDHEIIQKINDRPLRKCPTCGGKMKKDISLSGFQLKGSGWYKDGYSSPKPDNTKAKEGTTSGGSGEKNGDTKGATPPSQTSTAAKAADVPASPPKKEKSGRSPASDASRKQAS